MVIRRDRKGRCSTARHLDVDAAPDAADEPAALAVQSASEVNVRMLPRVTDRVRCDPQRVKEVHHASPSQPPCSCLNMTIACAYHMRVSSQIVMLIAVAAGGEQMFSSS